MKKKIALLLAVIINLCTVFSFGLNESHAVSLTGNKGVRIAHYQPRNSSGVPESFLEYASKCGYNYILVDTNLYNSSARSDWDGAGGESRGGATLLRAFLKNEIKKANKYKLKFVPLISIGSIWSDSWEITSDNISWNTLTCDIDGKTRDFKSPTYTEGASGIDKSFDTYLGVLKKSMRDAKRELRDEGNPLFYNDLDYFHISYDEMFSLGSKDPYRMVAGYSSTADQEYIKKNGDNADAYYKLIASHIARRANQVSKVFPSTKTLLWADGFDEDDYSNGNRILSAWGTQGQGTIQLLTKNVLARQELLDVKDKIIMMPWHYEVCDSDKIVNQFKNAGYKIIFALSNGNRNISNWTKTWYNPDFTDTIVGACMTNWADADPNNAGKELYWESVPRPAKFVDLPYFAKVAGFYPENDDILSIKSSGTNTTDIDILSSDASGNSLVRAACGINISTSATMKALLADLDGDGSQEIIQISNENSLLKWTVLKNTSGAYNVSGNTSIVGTTSTIDFFTGDFDGDDKAEIIQLALVDGRLSYNVYKWNGNAMSQLYQRNNIAGAGALEYFVGDINGDGTADLVQFWEENGRINVGTWYSDESELKNGFGRTDIGGAGYIDFACGDMDRDGIMEIYQFWDDGGSFNLELYQCTDGSSDWKWSNTAFGIYMGTTDYEKILLGDYNGDGFIDICKVKTREPSDMIFEYYLSDGKGYKFFRSYGYGPCDKNSIIGYFPKDVDKDGKTDICVLKNTNGRLDIDTININKDSYINWNSIGNADGELFINKNSVAVPLH